MMGVVSEEGRCDAMQVILPDLMPMDRPEGRISAAVTLGY
jgi:hypothetical protein